MKKVTICDFPRQPRYPGQDGVIDPKITIAERFVMFVGRFVDFDSDRFLLFAFIVYVAAMVIVYPIHTLPIIPKIISRDSFLLFKSESRNRNRK